MPISLLRKAVAVRALCLICATQTFAPAASADNGPPVSILYYEPLQLDVSGLPDGALVTGTEISTLVFDAFGRRFILETGEIVSRPDGDGAHLRGHLGGLAGSWFSLVRDGGELTGIISDGRETWLIEATDRIAEHLVQPPGKDTPANVIFRLKDLLIPPGLVSCAIHDGGPADAQQAYHQLTAELLATGAEITTSPELPLRLGVIGDHALYQRLDAETATELTAVFDNARAIVASEIGLDVEIEDVFVAESSDSEPFTDTVDASELLEELGQWRFDNQPDLGHTHLLTGKAIVSEDGNSLAGISYLGVPGRSGICNPRTGVSLSKYNNIRSLTSLIVTHELGHNLGAPHDSDFDGDCPDTPGTSYIMAPKISNQTVAEFSACTLSKIDALLAEATCLYGEAPDAPPAAESGQVDENGGGGGGSLGLIGLILLFTAPLIRRSRPHHPG